MEMNTVEEPDKTPREKLTQAIQKDQDPDEKYYL
jgi:hypothetical protein